VTVFAVALFALAVIVLIVLTRRHR